MRFSLQIKLALISLPLLFIPFAGLRYSEILQQDLLDSRRQTIQFSASAIASALSGRTGLFEDETFHFLNANRDLYLFQLSNPIRLNGKADDWYPQLDEAFAFGEDHILSSTTPYDYKSLHFKHLTGVRGDYLYAIFLVTDDQVIYRHSHSPHLDQSDHLQVAIEDQGGVLHRYSITPTKPGWVNGLLESDPFQATLPLQIESRIQGMWVETENGYIIELRIPMPMVGKKLAFAIADVDDNFDREITSLIGTGTPNRDESLGWLIPPSRTIEEILKTFNRPNSRIMIVDNNHRVRASYGNLSDTAKMTSTDPSLITRVNNLFHQVLTPLYTFFTTPFSKEFTEKTVQPTTLDISGISEVLQTGTSTITSYTLEDDLVEIMAAISPLHQNDQILGAVIVEQTTNSILALQNKVIEESLTLTIIVFIIGGLSLITYATRLSWRIRTLGRQAAAAINENGQVLPTIQPSTVNDEVGDLSKILINMLNQLQIQTEYREKMADNLEHEMRTPLAGISASLKNLSQEMEPPDENISRYLEWALSDVNRLEELLSAIRDATNLQEALNKDQKEDFELDTAIELWLAHSWQPAFTDVSFKYNKPDSPITLHGDPGRIHQMLDKLIENAVSFHDPETPIEIILAMRTGKIMLQVANQGPTIPVHLHKQIFNSMVSYRPQKRSGAHLGLGLYIVRTIALQYQGTIEIGSYPNGTGTIFTLHLNPKIP